MGERKLKNRKKAPPSGKVIRVSDLVYSTLDDARRGRSWDNYIRRAVGLPDRHGRIQPLVEGILEVSTGQFMLKTQAVTWAELEQLAHKIAFQAAERSKFRKLFQPLRMREVV